MNDDLEALAAFIVLCRACQRIICENIIAAMSIKAFVLILALAGVVGLWVAGQLLHVLSGVRWR